MPTTGCQKRQQCRHCRLTHSNKLSGGLVTFVGLTDTRGLPLWGCLVLRQTAFLFTLSLELAFIQLLGTYAYAHHLCMCLSLATLHPLPSPLSQMLPSFA